MLDNYQELLDADYLSREVARGILEKLRDDESADLDERRKAALLTWLHDTDPDSLHNGYSDNSLCYGRGEYLVLTDDEADEAAAEHIEQSLWAFNADFLSGLTGIDSSVFAALSDKCESANDAVLSIVKSTCGLEELVKQAVGCDGRGHFLAGYDGEENESGEFYIYRTN